MDKFSVFSLDSNDFLTNVFIDSDCPDGILESMLVEGLDDSFKNQSVFFKLNESENERKFDRFELKYFEPTIDDII